MSKAMVIDSIGRIDDDIIQKVNAVRIGKKRKLEFRKWISLAACFILVLSVALTAEAANGTVSNLLAPLFGGAQTEIIDKIGVPIGASTSVSGYTLTVDAIIGDRYSVMIAYTLYRDDGQPIPDNIEFQSSEVWASGYGTPIIIDEEDPSVAHFHERMRRNEILLDRIVTVAFSNLIVDNGETEDIVAEGKWELTFTIRYPDVTEELPVKSFDVTDDGGQKYTVKGIMLSPVGIHIDLVAYELDSAGGFFKDFKVSLIMKDGTELALENGGGGGKWTEGDKKTDVSYYAEFDIPIPSEDIKAVVICNTLYELNNLSKEPGSALPVLVFYEGSIFAHNGYVIYELPENLEFIGNTKNVGNSQISENFDANESGSLYKESNNNDVLYFQYDNWDEEVDGGKEPYLLLYRKSK